MADGRTSQAYNYNWGLPVQWVVNRGYVAPRVAPGPVGHCSLRIVRAHTGPRQTWPAFVGVRRSPAGPARRRWRSFLVLLEERSALQIELVFELVGIKPLEIVHVGDFAGRRVGWQMLSLEIGEFPRKNERSRAMRHKWWRILLAEF